MRVNLRTPLIIFTIAVGLVVLLGYFVHIPLLESLHTIFLRWAVILSAVALLVGAVNLVKVHWSRLSLGSGQSVYSGVLLLSLLVTVGVVGYYGPTAPLSIWIFDSFQVPVEGSLMAIVSIVLVYAAARLLRRQMSTFSLVFLLTALLVLVGTASLPLIDLPVLGTLRNWIVSTPAAAGGRGILLGVALGTITAGLRILMGADRPYGG